MLSMILPMSAFALAASISPGPVNLLCLSSGIRFPVRVGLVFVSGATLGFIALFLLVGVGLYSALSVVPEFHLMIRWAGAAFLIYLGIRLFLDTGRLQENDVGDAPGFLTGVIMQWLNPKAWLASASGIGAYTGGDSVHQVVVFAALYLPICWLSLSCWVCAGAYFRHYVQNRHIIVVMNRGLAILLIASCAYLLLE